MTRSELARLDLELVECRKSYTDGSWRNHGSRHARYTLRDYACTPPHESCHQGCGHGWLWSFSSRDIAGSNGVKQEVDGSVMRYEV
jgi:hypothetical protein